MVSVRKAMNLSPAFIIGSENNDCKNFFVNFVTLRCSFADFFYGQQLVVAAVIALAAYHVTILLIAFIMFLVSSLL